MGINRETDTAASLVIGPTSLGMVRIYIEAEGVDLPMDFEPDEALEIAEELRAAAERARDMGQGQKPADRASSGSAGPAQGGSGPAKPGPAKPGSGTPPRDKPRPRRGRGGRSG